MSCTVVRATTTLLASVRISSHRGVLALLTPHVTGKDTSGQRLTYLLRPNVTRPNRLAMSALDTPPVTDLSDLSELSAHEFDTESEPISDRDFSDAEGPVARGPARGLGAIVELSDGSAPPSPAVGARYAGPSVPSMAALDDGWSVIGGSDVEGDMSAPEEHLERGVAALDLSDADGDVDRTFTVDLRRRQGPEALRSRLLDRQRRAASSPSRSPARRTPRRARRGAEPVREAFGRKSFYDYLYS